MWMTLSSPQLASLRPSELTLSDWTAPLCPSRSRTDTSSSRSHQLSIPSLPPLSSSSPVGLQASAYTFSLGSRRACNRSPLLTSQTKSSPPPLPPPPLASKRPSGLHATLMTMPRCPCSDALTVPSENSNRKTLPLSLPLPSRVPPRSPATPRPLPGSARLIHRRMPVSTSHTSTPCSKL